MPSMFPGMSIHPDDPNRRPRVSSGDPSNLPRPLAWGYYLCVVAAVIMVLAGLIMLTSGYSGDGGVSQEIIDAYLRNVNFIGIFNIIAGLLIAALAAQLKTGGKVSRRVLAGVIGLALFFNIAAFAIQVGGFSHVVIVLLLIIALLMMFRADSNRYFAHLGDSKN